MNGKRKDRGQARGRQKADITVARPLAEGDTFLPHERDEAPGRGGRDASEGKASRDTIEQAQKDISAGLKDTDLHGTPSNVPGPIDAGQGPEKKGETSVQRPPKPAAGAAKPGQ